MKFLVLFGVIAAVFAAPVPDEGAPKEFELKQVSDVDGSYSFTFATEDQSKTESRTPDGTIRGAYSYIDSDGILQKVQYLSDENGFQAYGTNLPVGSTVPVKETPEVLEATAQHFALVDEHLKKVALHEKLHEELKSLHPELFEDKVVHVPVSKKVVHVVHVTPVTKNIVQVVKKVEPVVKKVHHVELVEAPVVKKVHVVHHETPVVKKVVHHVTPVVHHHTTPVIKKVPIEYHVVSSPVVKPVVHHLETPVVKTVVHHVSPVRKVVPVERHEIPLPPDEDDEVKAAREAHLALVEKLTAQHLAAVAAAPKHEE